MSPTRRALLGALAGGVTALAGCGAPTADQSPTTGTEPTASDATDAPTFNESTGTPTASAPPLVLEPADASTVPDDATVAPVGELDDAVRLAAMGGRAELATREFVLSPRACATYEGTTYELTVEERSGTYFNEYRVERIDELGDREEIDVANLSADRRSTVTSAIENGEYTYDSIDGGFQPLREAYRYEGALYVFEQTIHADRPTLTFLSFRAAADGDGCFDLVHLSNQANNHFAWVIERDDHAPPYSVPERHREEVRQFDHLVTIDRVFAVRNRR